MEIDDKEFEILLKEKKHKEIINLMTKLLKELSNQKDVKVNVDMSKIEDMISTINTQPDFSSIPKSIDIIGNAIIKKIDSIKKDTKPLIDTFDVLRNKDQRINKIKINYKKQ